MARETRPTLWVTSHRHLWMYDRPDGLKAYRLYCIEQQNSLIVAKGRMTIYCRHIGAAIKQVEAAEDPWSFAGQAVEEVPSG